MQQLILFTPRHVDLASFIPIIEKGIASSHLVLRRACFASLRQLVQRQPDVARMHGKDMEARLFKQLDMENDAVAHSDICETILNMLTAMCEKEPSFWLRLCNSVLSGADEREVQVVVEEVAQTAAEAAAPAQVNLDEDAHQPEVDDDEIGQGALQGQAAAERVVVPTRWESKVREDEYFRSSQSTLFLLMIEH